MANIKLKKIPFYSVCKYKRVGAFNYMDWDQIKELHNYEFVEIGNHSHSHEYLSICLLQIIEKDILKSIKIFKEKLGKFSFFLIHLVNIVLNLKK